MITTEQRKDVDEVLHPLDAYAHQCHQASLTIVKARIFPGARVARGAAVGVPGQHSWVVLGGDVYAPMAIVDPTVWSYTGRKPEVTYYPVVGPGYTPHGSGSILTSPKPYHYGGETIELEGDLGPSVRRFLEMVGPLDVRGWMHLFNSPVQYGWPAREIISAAYLQKNLRAYIPIDIVGHLTDYNPGGLYLSGEETP